MTVVAIKAEDSTYNSVSSAPLTITIEKIKVTIPAEDKTIYTYNGTEQIYKLRKIRHIPSLEINRPMQTKPVIQ